MPVEWLSAVPSSSAGLSYVGSMLCDTEKVKNGFHPHGCLLTPPGLTVDSLVLRPSLPPPSHYHQLFHELKNPLGFLPSCLFFNCTVDTYYFSVQNSSAHKDGAGEGDFSSSLQVVLIKVANQYSSSWATAWTCGPAWANHRTPSSWPHYLV